MNMSFRSEVMKGFSTFKKSDLKSERKRELKLKLLSKFPLLEKTMSFKASLKYNFRVWLLFAFPFMQSVRFLKFYA